MGVSSFAYDFKTIGGSSSRPEALLVDSIPWSVIVISLMYGKTVGGKVEMLNRFSVVKLMIIAYSIFLLCPLHLL